MTLVGYHNEGVLFSWTTAWTGHSGSFKSAGFHFGTPEWAWRGGRELVMISESHPLCPTLWAGRREVDSGQKDREREQSWQRTAGIMSGADVKDFLLNLTSEYSRCASRAGNRGEKLHKLRRSLWRLGCCLRAYQSRDQISFFFIMIRE